MLKAIACLVSLLVFTAHSAPLTLEDLWKNVKVDSAVSSAMNMSIEAAKMKAKRASKHFYPVGYLDGLGSV